MKIVTHANRTRNWLAALHCAILFSALSAIGTHAVSLPELVPPELAAATGPTPFEQAGFATAIGELPQQIIVKSREHGISRIMQRLEKISGSSVQLVRSMSDNAHVVALPGIRSAELARQWIARLTDTGMIEYGQLDAAVSINTVPAATHLPAPLQRAQPFARRPNDALYAQQWLMGSPLDYPAAINIEQAWELTTGSADVVVAIIDTGMLFDHSDLNNRLLPGYDFVSGLNEAPETIMPVHAADNYLKSNDGNGRDLDASDPGDGVDPAFQEYMLSIGYDCPLINSTWHGTAMASLLAANGNDGIGMAGVDWHLKILPVRAIGRCGGNRSDLLDAIRWAAGVPDPALPPNPNPARIINLSLGIDDVCGPADQQAINDAVNAGAIIVSAVGNHGRNTDEVPTAPSDCRHVIGVGSVDSDGARSSYSNYGDDADIAAPGGDLGGSSQHKVLVATNDGTTLRMPGSSHRYTTGTSVASPLVAGVLSLMLSINPDLNNAELEALLYASARPFMYVGGDNTQCRQSSCGAGMLDAHAAVLAARDSLENPPEVAAAVVSDDFIITTGSENFGCSVVGTGAGGNRNPALDPIWLLLLATLYLLRRRNRPAVRRCVQGSRRKDS